MTINWNALNSTKKLLIEASLQPVQGSRFQPTGFPDLGAALFESNDGEACVLVESPQSMANRLESVCWDESAQDLVGELKGLSYVSVEQDGAYLTSSIEESHRLNSPYILKSKDKSFFNALKDELVAFAEGPVDRGRLAATLLRRDANSLIHGIFLAQKELAGGRLRLERALGSFIEAKGVQVAASGGVKKDHVNPKGATNEGFGHVPFHREEFTAKQITAYFNLDLAQIRGYRLSEEATRMLVLLAMYKIRAVLEGNLRLRTACDLDVVADGVAVTRPDGFTLPSLEFLQGELPKAIAACAGDMAGKQVVTFKK